MRRKIDYVKSFYMIMPILTGIFLICTGFLAGCTKSLPMCDSKKVKKVVIEQHIEELKSQVAGVAEAGGQPGMELTEDEWRLMRAGMNFELRNIKQFSFDEASGILDCQADLVTFSSGMESSMPIEYTAEVVKGTDQVLVTIYELE